MEPEILFTELTGPQGNIGEITLNRPKMLNALTQSMCIAMYAEAAGMGTGQPDQSHRDSRCGERAFCAGGDIRAVYELRAQPELARQFFGMNTG